MMRYALVSLLLIAACASQPRTIKIPDSALADPKSNGKEPKKTVQPYVIKMSDGQRTWQIEIPVNNASGAFEASVPLIDLGEEAKKPPEGAADREIKRARPKKAGPVAKPESTPEDSQSYLATLANVNNLFRKRQYEIALMELVKLERAYPEDERVLEMKGTLYFRLRKPKLAREAWERVLAINPENAMVAQALENIGGE